jgi:hypothetical protein
LRSRHHRYLVRTRCEAFADTARRLLVTRPSPMAATAVDGVAHKSALPPMSMCTPKETNCRS